MHWYFTLGLVLGSAVALGGVLVTAYTAAVGEPPRWFSALFPDLYLHDGLIPTTLVMGMLIGLALWFAWPAFVLWFAAYVSFSVYAMRGPDGR